MYLVIYMKRNRQRTYKTTTSTELDYVRLIKISLGVLVVFGLVYFVTALFSGEINFDKKSTPVQETVIQYQEIIGGDMLNKNADNYYVLLYDPSIKKIKEDYTKLISSYSAKDNSLPFYVVDLSKKINEEYKEVVGQETNELDHVVVKDILLVKVTNGSISETYEGYSRVNEFFNNN